MNPTNESIGRTDVEAMLAACVPGGSICDPQKVADNIREYFARELDRQAPGELSGEALRLSERENEWLEYAIDHMLDDSEPEDLTCAEVLRKMLDRSCIVTPAPQPPAPQPPAPAHAVVEMQCPNCLEIGPCTVIPAPQPPAQEQGEALPVIADYTPVSPEEEAAVDSALGLVKVRMRVPADLHRELVAESEARELVLAAVIRERLTRAAGAEDARDAEDAQQAYLAMIDIRDVAREAHIHWDADRDAKVGKILLALGGRLPGYSARIDKFHEAIGRLSGEAAIASQAQEGEK